MKSRIHLSFIVIGMLMYPLTLLKSQEIKLSCPNVNIAPGTTMIISNGANLINDSVSGMLGGTVIFYGSVDTMSISGARNTTFHHLVLDNDAVVRLYADVSIDSSLSLIKGIINTAGKNITILEDGEISGTFTENNMVALNGNGKFIYRIPAAGTYFYPVGDIDAINDYTPVNLVFNNGSFNNAEVSLGMVDAKHPANSSVTNYISRYWTINQTGISNFNCAVEFNFLNEDIVGNEANMYGGKWNGSYWIPLNQVSLNSITGNVNGFSDFTAGEHSVLNVDIPLEDKVEILVEGNAISINLLDNSGLEYLEIYNSLGQKVFYKDLRKLEHLHFDFNSEKGVYLLKISGEQNYLSKKIAIY